MTHKHYKEPISKDEAIKELKNNVGTAFDEEVVQVFINKVINYEK